MSQLTVRPSREAEKYNKLISDPEILPHIRDDSIKGIPNIGPLLNRYNHALLVEDDGKPVGFALFIMVGPGIYEMHSGFLKECRGPHALEAGKMIFDWMFLTTDCETITTWAWSSAKNVLFMANAAGFVQDAEIPWPETVGGKKVNRHVFSMSLLEWSRTARYRNQKDGWLLGVALETYQMGLFTLFVKMGINGYAQKAVMMYQRWAPVLRLPMVNVLGALGGKFTIEVEGQVIQIDSELETTILEQKPKPPEGPQIIKP